MMLLGLEGWSGVSLRPLLVLEPEVVLKIGVQTEFVAGVGTGPESVKEPEQGLRPQPILELKLVEKVASIFERR